MYCVTCDQIDEWLTRFKEKKNPGDLVIIDNPRFYLSCRVGDSRDEAYACYGDGLSELIESSEDVYNIAELNCDSPESPDCEINTMIDRLTEIRRRLPESSPDTVAYFEVNRMLGELRERKNLLNLGQWTEYLNGLAGAQEPAIQNALKLAKDLHELWTNQSSD